MNIDFDVETISGNTVELNSISSLGGYRNNGLEIGKTETTVQVRFINGDKGDI